MAKFIHLSDLHFGAHDPVLVDAVEARVHDEKADLVIISGDFTQRAKTEEFQQACEFLTRLRDGGHEVLAVPGNHDVPLYDVIRRFLSPLTRYKRFIDETLCPFHDLPTASVLGINTARSATIKDGSINHEQIDFIHETFAKTDPKKPRVLVTHHPLFALPVGDGPHIADAIHDQKRALKAIAEAGVDLLLAGHNHHSSAQTAESLATGAGTALVVQAGTATSVRVRGQAQSFNLVSIDGNGINVIVQNWDGATFVANDAEHFERHEGSWELGSGEKVEEAPA